MKTSAFVRSPYRTWFRIGCGVAIFSLSLVVAQVTDVIDLTKVTFKDPIKSAYFQGTVLPVNENSTGNFAHYKFTSGARTQWHIHEGGQILLCEEGICRHQLKGGPIIEFRAGETAYAPPGVAHWQGSTPTTSGTQFNIHRGKITWLNDVTDAEYNGPVAPHK
jgi:quercetin dioxygenase-like cupin family protein